MRKKPQKHNPLAAAEMSAESNYNMIDGIINNEKPSVLERMAVYERNIKQHIERENKRHEEDNREER